MPGALPRSVPFFHKPFRLGLDYKVWTGPSDLERALNSWLVPFFQLGHGPFLGEPVSLDRRQGVISKEVRDTVVKTLYVWKQLGSDTQGVAEEGWEAFIGVVQMYHSASGPGPYPPERRDGGKD